jgi:endonuclease G
MKPINHDLEATKRFEIRELQRQAHLQQVAQKGPLKADERQRVENRRAVINPKDGVALERILGKSDLMAINYLEIGLRAAGPVCRVQVRDSYGRVLGYGTGFMVSPSLMMTNNHVLPRVEEARRSLAEFNFEDDEFFTPKPIKTFPLEPERFFYTDVTLDFSLVAVRPLAIDGSALEPFGYLKLREIPGMGLAGEYVTAIQHPEGAAKQVTLRENQLVDVFDDYVHYLTDTQPGSSGSPVFNDQWEVLALHHAGVKKRDSAGRVLAKDGRVWTPSMGEDQIDWIANEGIRISSILAHLKASAGWTVEQKRLLNEIFAPAVPVPAAGGGEMHAVEQSLEWYAGSTGYDPDFLGTAVPLPSLPADRQDDIASLLDGSGHELKYTHFSLVMSKSRCLAFFTAVNIDGAQAQDLKRDADRWYYDPRIGREIQMGPKAYEKNDLDRGHLVRRLDPVWGEPAKEANEDTFHFTNCSPQHKNLNQVTWQNLEDYILNNAETFGLKVSVFTGPVFRADDMLYREKFRIPAEFWKVVVMAREDGSLSATAYLQTQKNLLVDLEFAYGQYQTYQVPVTQIESLTGLDFGALRDHDPLGDIEATAVRQIAASEDIRL